jgi:glucose/arabinose dehydrogenase
MLSGLACADASDPAGPGGPVAPEPPPADTVPPPQDLELRADLFLSGLEAPVLLTHAPGDDRLFIVEQPGRVRVATAAGQLAETPYLDLTDEVSFQGERGLLGLAFHPSFQQNRQLFVSFTDPGGTSRVRRFTETASGERADPDSGLDIIVQAQPFSNHNGGHVAFGPDGMLYFGLGDGGSGGDPQGHGQNRATLLGALLRLDVDAPDAGRNYGIPVDNPFTANPQARDEIWAYGLRNPWRFSFDHVEERLYIGDVGQNTREEVSVVDASDGGHNFGWNLREGDRCFLSTPCDDPDLTDPVIAYDNPAAGCSVTGGYVYRGEAIPELVGTYLYSDFCAGRLEGFRLVDGAAQQRKTWIPERIGGVTSLGEDRAGELYILTAAGSVYLLRRR